MTAARNAIMGQGLPPEAPWVTFPYALYLSDSDVAGIIGPKMGEIISNLTTWKSTGTYTKGQIITRDPAAITAKDYPTLWQNLQFAYLSKNWGDGNPVTPATKAMIDWILTGVPEDAVTGKVPDRNAVIGKGDGKVYPKCGILTYEVLATCMAMAGGRPEYMPVAIAACETIITSQNTTLTSSMSAYPVTLVNGPIARQIRLSTGFGLLGPDPNRPAGSAIKRCLWFVHQGTGGLVSGGGTIAQFGYMRPGGVCFAETDEVNLPPGWKTYTEERFSRSKGTNSVTYGLSSGGAIRDFTHRGSGSEPDHVVELQESFDRFASTVIGTPTSGVPADAQGSNLMWLIPQSTANDMVTTAGTDLGKKAGVAWADKEGIKKQAAASLWYNVDDIRDRSGVVRSCK
jgi:hypothetical protein